MRPVETIEPGAELSFQADSDIMGAGTIDSRGELIVRGRLIADGTPEAPISIGSTMTGSGRWYGIELQVGAHDSVLDHVTIRGGYDGLIYRSTGTGNVLTNVTAESAMVAGLRLRAGSPTIDGWRSVSSGTAGISVEGSASPTITNCIVRQSGQFGIRILPGTPGQTVAILNCTLDANSQTNVYINASPALSPTVAIVNSILTSSSYGVYRTDSATVSVTYSDVWNNSSGDYFGVSPGIGTISEDPRFVSATDLRLQPTSPAIDAGTAGPPRDADGVVRPVEGDGLGTAAWDMGAYELVPVTECGNGVVEPGEACDSGASNGMYGHCDATCAALGPRCGDGTVQAAVEACDDGNVAPDDGCSPTCTIEPEPEPEPEPGGGCCQSSDRGSLGALLLAGAVALGLRRRRRTR